MNVQRGQHFLGSCPVSFVHVGPVELDKVIVPALLHPGKSHMWAWSPTHAHVDHVHQPAVINPTFVHSPPTSNPVPFQLEHMCRLQAININVSYRCHCHMRRQAKETGAHACGQVSMCCTVSMIVAAQTNSLIEAEMQFDPMHNHNSCTDA